MFAPEVYAARRQAFMERIGPRAVAIVHSLPEATRNALRFVWLHTVDDAVAAALEKPGPVMRGEGFELV